MPLREWVHVAGTWDGEEIRLYANGLEAVAPKDSRVTGLHDTQLAVQSGARHAMVGHPRSFLFNGLLDEIYVFDCALGS